MPVDEGGGYQWDYDKYDEDEERRRGDAIRAALEATGYVPPTNEPVSPQEAEPVWQPSWVTGRPSTTTPETPWEKTQREAKEADARMAGFGDAMGRATRVNQAGPIDWLAGPATAYRDFTSGFKQVQGATPDGAALNGRTGKRYGMGNYPSQYGEALGELYGSEIAQENKWNAMNAALAARAAAPAYTPPAQVAPIGLGVAGAANGTVTGPLGPVGPTASGTPVTAPVSSSAVAPTIAPRGVPQFADIDTGRNQTPGGIAGAPQFVEPKTPGTPTKDIFPETPSTPATAGGGTSGGGTTGGGTPGGRGTRGSPYTDWDNSQSPLPGEEAWWQAFTYEHNGQSPADYYKGNVAQARADRDWGAAFAAWNPNAVIVDQSGKRRLDPDVWMARASLIQLNRQSPRYAGWGPDLEDVEAFRQNSSRYWWGRNPNASPGVTDTGGGGGTETQNPSPVNY